MPYRRTPRDGAPVYNLEATLGHRRPVVIAEVERQPFDQGAPAEIGVLALMMEVDVRLARVPGVTAAPDRLPFFNLVTLSGGDAAALQVCDL
jgi:hypothetical protein